MASDKTEQYLETERFNKFIDLLIDFALDKIKKDSQSNEQSKK